MALFQALQSGKFFSLTNIEALQLLSAHFRPELVHLKNATPTLEANNTPTLGDLGDERSTPSQLLFSEDYIEVNRTLVSMLAFKWIMADDYASFTKHQNNRCLTKESFARLSGYVQNYNQNAKNQLALLTAIAVSDIGKDPSLLRDVSRIMGPMAPTPNHDEIAHLALSQHMIPAFESLDDEDRRDIALGMQVGAKLNIAQLAQAENVPGSILPMFGFKGENRALHIKIIEVLLDVAGAGGHVDARSAVRMTQAVYQKESAAVEALINLVEGRLATVEECYDQVLQTTARNLEADGFRPLSAKNPDGRALLRILIMARVEDKSHAAGISSAFEAVPPTEKRALINGLNATGVAGSYAVIPYYAPAVFAQLSKMAKKEIVITAFLRLLSKVCTPPHEEGGHESWIVERDLSFIMPIVKGGSFESNPDVLMTTKLPWEAF